MVLKKIAGPILGSIISRGIYNYNRYSKWDDKIWKSAYPVPSYGARAGVKHGLAVGTAAGGLIMEDSIDSPNGQILQPQTYQPNKTRKRFTNSRSGKYANRAGNRTRCRCSNNRKSGRGTNRMQNKRVFRNYRSRRFRKYNNRYS